MRDVLDKLDSLRARGADRVAPMRFRVIEALAQRTTKHEGAARRVLDARLAALLDAYERDAAASVDAVRVADANANADASALTALLDDLRRRADAHTDPAELLDHLRIVWSKVSADKRLRESLAQVPKNAGPLNSSSLVHRALSLMQDVSPDYLQHFLGYLDSLAWMDALMDTQADTQVPAPKAAPRAPAAKKTARGKSR
jgi:hypothetical protein